MRDHSPRGMAREKYAIKARDSGSREGRDVLEVFGGGGGTWRARTAILRCLASKAGFVNGVM